MLIDTRDSVFSWAFPVTVTYTDGTIASVGIKINVLTVNTWMDNTKASARIKLLDVVNGFRSSVQSRSVALDTTAEYQAYMDQRAAEKAKQYAETRTTDHSGQTIQDKYNVISTENISGTLIISSDSLDAQIKSLVDIQHRDSQEEKDDYEAVNIRHERNYLINSAGTVLHYINFIDSRATKVIFGIGTYTKADLTYIVTVAAVIMG